MADHWEDLNTWHLDLAITADALEHVLMAIEEPIGLSATGLHPAAPAGRAGRVLPVPGEGRAMIEKHRRQKKPRAHPHFVWADPARFYAERMAAGLTQDQACEYLGVTRRTMYNWEKGLNRIPYPAFKLIRMRAGAIVHVPGLGWVALCP